MNSTAFIQSRHQHQNHNKNCHQSSWEVRSSWSLRSDFLEDHVTQHAMSSKLPACQIWSFKNPLRNLKPTWNQHDTTIVITKDWRSFKVTVKLKAKTTEAKVPWPVLDEAPIRWIIVRCLCLWSLENSQKVISIGVQTAQIQTRNTPGSIGIASLSLCRAAVRADLHRIFGWRTSVDPNKRKGNEWNERLGSLAWCGWLGWLALPQSLHQFRRSVLVALPHSDRHFFSMRRKAQTAGTCAEIGFMGCVETALTHGLGHGWSINRSRSIGWSLLPNSSWLLTAWKQVGSWGGKQVNIPRPWKYLFNNCAKPVKPKLRVTESASKIVHAVPGHTL